MAITQQTSGTISSYGTFTLPDTDWETIPGMSGSPVAPATGSWHHVVGDFTRTVQHGNCTVQVLCIQATYQWDGASWSRVSGAEDPAGYPAALGTLAANQCATAQAREYRCIATAGSVTNTASAGAGHWIGVWVRGPMGCFPAPIGSTSITVSGVNVNVASVSWSIDHDEIPLVQVVSEETTDARAHATCVHQLRDSYHWAGDIDVSATCGSATSSDTVSYSSTHLPVFTVGLSYGAGQNYSGVLPSQLCPSGLMCMQARAYSRPAESMGITWTLSSQYGSGLRASGSIVDLVDPVYSDDVLTYSFTNTSMTGTVPSASAITSCCDTPPLMMVSASHQEYIYAETSIGIDLVACDQMTTLTTGAGLKANATHFIDQTMDWDAGNQKYVQSVTYSDPLELDVPGSYSMSFQRTSRYEDRLVPNSADDVIRVELTSASLGALDLPIADHVMTLHDRALDAIGIDTADWGDHDEHGGPYYGLLLIWVQSPLSVQWAQDDRGEAAPPSWWYDTFTTSPLTRQATIQAVASFGGGPSNPIRRDLAWHPTRRNEDWYGGVDPGIAEADLWKWVGDWQRLSATKHLLAGTVIGGPFDMTSGDVTCGEEDPVDHTAYGIMPWSEDVTDWRLYRWVRFIITSDAVAAWDLTVTVAYEWDDITDGYESATDDRRTSYQCQTHHGTAVYTVNVPGSAASANCDIDLIGANAPYLERVTSITLTGLPGGYDETVIEDVQLIAPTAGVWVESTDQRPVAHGGEERYTCGSEPEYLGLAQTPEEYGGWWAMGGHCVARGVRNPGRDVSIAPDWGMPYVIRRVTSCGALQDELMQFSAWHGQRVGDWGLEGLYGQLHNEITDAAMSDWVDGDDTPLGLATGAGWITHVPILLQFPIGSQDLLSAGRDQDGATDIPVIVRAGCLRPAQGLNWAHSGAGTAPDFGFKIILYGARLDVATSGTAPVGRAGNGLTYTLYEHPSTGYDRLVTTAVTDADSRLRFAKGVNEFRHVEYGADAMSDPDWLNRYDYTSDILAPGEVVGDLDFGRHHYQVIPTMGLVVVLPEGALARVSITRPIGDGCVILAYQESGTLEVWARRSPDHGEHWMPDEYLADGVLPSATRRADGTAAVAYVYEGAAYVTMWNGTAWGGPQLILADADVVDHEADRFSSAHYVVAQDWTTGDLTCHVTWERGGAWTSIEVGTIAADADADTVPSIKQAADGSLRVAYIAGGSVVTKHSNDEGVTWV
jgi:hypothetical protein